MNNLRNRHVFLGPIIVSGIVFTLAMFPMPYGFYSLSRLIICALAIYGATLLKERNEGLFWTMVGLAILYNPIIPIHLYEKSLWFAINIATLAVFIWVNKTLMKGENVSSESIAKHDYEAEVNKEIPNKRKVSMPVQLIEELSNTALYALQTIDWFHLNEKDDDHKRYISEINFVHDALTTVSNEKDPDENSSIRLIEELSVMLEVAKSRLERVGIDAVGVSQEWLDNCYELLERAREYTRCSKRNL